MSKHKEVRSSKTKQRNKGGRQSRMRATTLKRKVARIKRHMKRHPNDKCASRALKAL